MDNSGIQQSGAFVNQDRLRIDQRENAVKNAAISTTNNNEPLTKPMTTTNQEPQKQQQQQMILTRPDSCSSSAFNGNNKNNSLDTTNQQQQQQHSASHNLPANQNLLANNYTSNLQASALNDEQLKCQQRESANTTVVFARIRTRWYTNEEVASILTNFSQHPEWLTNELQVRPKSGAVLLYSREKVRYRQDGYCWKKRKNGRTTREDHMKLKVQGIECIYGCYVHSAILPTFHRRCYWLLQNPDIVLVHYLNQPPEDQNKLMITFNSSLLEADTRRSWTNEEIIEEIGSVFGGISQIQHTLNINFPTSTAILQQQQQQQQQQQVQVQVHQAQQSQHQLQQVADLDRMIESSPQSVSNSSEQIDMTIADQQQAESLAEQQHQQQQEDELMTNLNQDVYSNNSNEPLISADAFVLKSIKCEDSSSTSGNETNGHVQQQQQQLVEPNMTFNVINEQQQQSDAQKSDSSLVNDGRRHQHHCFSQYPGSNDHQSSATVPGSTATSANNTNSNSNSNNNNNNTANVTADTNCINRSSSTDLLICATQMEQNLCSPVTQIYNKIVDDIETYALPLEPNQFQHHHHHHHHHQQQQQQHHHQNNHLHHNHHHSMSASSLPVVHSMDISNCSTPNEQQKHQQPTGQQLVDQQQQASHGRADSDNTATNATATTNAAVAASLSIDSNNNSINKQLSTASLSSSSSNCPMAMETCDLFDNNSSDNSRVVGHPQQHQLDNQSRVADSVPNDDDHLLLSDFNLTTGDHHHHQVTSDSVVDSLANVDDLRDIMLGISSSSSTGNASGDHNNLLVDTNSLDLFNFKTTNDCDQQQQHQRLDVKSTTSDTDMLNRLSPLIPVPRCNSTGNAMQTSTLEQHHQQQQHLSSQYLTCIAQQNHTANLMSGCTNLTGNQFSELQLHHHSSGNNNNNNNNHRSLSANPSSSTSCSHSSSSLRLTGAPSLTHSACAGVAGTNSHFNTSSASSPSTQSTFMKLPLQQRQRSEQQEPSNSVLSSLLPKAVSLDGTELSTTCHRVITSPLIHYPQDSQEQRQQNQNSLLLIKSTSNQQQQSISEATNQLLTYQQQYGTSISPTAIPMDNSSEILVNNNTPMSDFHVYNSLAPNLSIPADSCNTEKSFTRLLPILDYVPNWSNITGGAKVLLVGNWSSLLTRSNEHHQQTQLFNKLQQQQQQVDQKQQRQSITEEQSIKCESSMSPFCALFDDLLVPASLIQDNVLRCYAPSHEEGFVTLKVLYLNRIVSEQVLFEMRPSCSGSAQLNSSSLQQQKQQQQHYQKNNSQNGVNQEQNSGTDNNNNNTNNTQQQHRNSTSSNQSMSSISLSTTNQKPQVSPGNSFGTGSGGSDRVLTLAENIISAMHRKNSTAGASSVRPTTDFRLASSLDIESLENHHYFNSSTNYQQQQQQQQQHHQQSAACQRQRSLKGSQSRQFTGFRSLSRDSEPISNYCLNHNHLNLNLSSLLDSDPYWHQSPRDATAAAAAAATFQPLSVITDDFQQPSNCCTFNNYQPTQKRYSGSFLIGNNSNAINQQASAFVPYAVQRPTLNHSFQTSFDSSAIPSVQSNHMHTETTSSSGLGSIVSSLSPSSSSLHSPASSACTATREIFAHQSNNNHGTASPGRCSCGRQSSGTPTSADFCEYFQASAKTEESFASLTLNDHEQQELYEAAKVIQKAYRTYRGRKRQASELLGDRETVLVVPAVVTPSPSSEWLHEQQLVSEKRSSFGSDLSISVTSGCSGTGAAGAVASLSSRFSTPTSAQVKCYRDREMQAATIIQAYYRRYRQYVHYKRRISKATTGVVAATNSGNAGAITGLGVQVAQDRRSPNARIVVDTMPVMIDKATLSHVDRKRFKTAMLMSSKGVETVAG